MINYTFEVIAVDVAARCMEVVYASEGRQTLHIGTRLPYAGETLEQVVQMYAPIPHWLEREKVVESPEVGATGAVDMTPAAPTPAQITVAFTTAIQQRLDTFAQTRNYDSILSACTYATSTVPKFKTEGQACVNLRDATWAAAYQILADVQAGDRPMPASIADIEADLPAAVWPV